MEAELVAAKRQVREGRDECEQHAAAVSVLTAEVARITGMPGPPGPSRPPARPTRSLLVGAPCLLGSGGSGADDAGELAAAEAASEARGASAHSETQTESTGAVTAAADGSGASRPAVLAGDWNSDHEMAAALAQANAPISAAKPLGARWQAR